jgi:cell division protein FtsB
MMSFGVILCGVLIVVGALAGAVGAFVLVMRKSRNAPNPSELAYLREEVARLNQEVERLRENVEQLKSGPRAAGSTDIKGR